MEFLIPIATVLISNLIGFAVIWGRLNERVRQIESQLKDNMVDDKTMMEHFNTLNLELQKISVALFGIDGKNGLRSNIHDTTVKIDVLRLEIQTMKEQILQHRD
jgi:hypothetical protein